MMEGIQQGYPGVTGAYAPQIPPQGLFGNLFSGPLGGVIGGGAQGLFGNANIGRQYPPVGMDPVTNAYQQQAQFGQQTPFAQQIPFGQQGIFGSPQGVFGHPLAGAIGGLFGNQQWGNQPWGNPQWEGQMGGIGQIARSPFGLDPITAAYVRQVQLAQQSQLVPQGLFGSPVGLIGHPLLAGAMGHPLAGLIGHPLLANAMGYPLAGAIGHTLIASAMASRLASEIGRAHVA